MSESQNTHAPPSLRQLNHDIGNDLAVLSMGLQALGGVCDDAKLFAEVTQTMQENLDSLKVKVRFFSNFSGICPAWGIF